MPKGIYDRPSSGWRPKPERQYPRELVEEVKRLYESGHTIREIQDRVKGAKVQLLMQRWGIPTRKAIPRNQRGSNNAAWKGDSASYSAFHLRVQTERGKPNLCTKCGVSGADVRYEWANLTGNYHDVGDYERMCVPCHRVFDASRRKAGGGKHV